MKDLRGEQPDDLKRRGMSLIQDNHLDEARALFEQHCRRHGDDAEAWHLLSGVYGRLGRIDKAEECCRRAIALRPDFSDAYLNLGNVFLHRGLHEEALDQYHAVLRFSPQHAGAHGNLGHVQAALGRYDEAVENYRAALLIDPSEALAGIVKNQGRSLMQDNRLAEAESFLKLVCEIRPRDVQAWHMLSTVNGRLGNMHEATECCRRVLAIQPNHCDAHVNLGHAHFQQGKLDEAVDLYLQALAINPLSVAALNNLGVVCGTREHFEKYIEAYRHAVADLPDPAVARTVFIDAIENKIPAKYEPWLDEELKQCFSIEGIDYKSISLTTAHILKYKHGITASYINDDDAIETTIGLIAGDDLFTAFLKKTINMDAEMEMLLTKVRRALLFKYSRENKLDDTDKRAISALAHQCFNNEYVFVTDPQEDRRLTDLKKSIEQHAASVQSPNEDLEIDLTVFAMYDALHTLSCRQHIARMPLPGWSEGFRHLLAETLIYPLEEESVMAKIGSVSPIQDRTSRLVQSQYEANPYPRWLAIPETQQTNISYALRQRFPHFIPPRFLDGPIRILIAGCGTGKEPIQTALSYKNHDVEMLAVDISKRSLAYATRMAGKYGVKNIRFVQGDILELSQLDERFHIIECGGVLHHLENPLAGWKVLTNLLVDGGLMSIALYSKAARKALAPFQEKIKHEGLARDGNSVRNFRKRILRGEMGDFKFFSQDFYSTSGCRDLLFHYMEHQYTPLQLDHMMNELKLEFIGFSLPDVKAKCLYRKQFPQDPEMTDLSLWTSFEELYPDTFAKMYQFWCQKL